MIAPDEQTIADIAAALGTTPDALTAALSAPPVRNGHLEMLIRVQERARQVYGEPTGNRRERRAMKARKRRR